MVILLFYKKIVYGKTDVTRFAQSGYIQKPIVKIHLSRI